jgi:hypothetical protein
MPRITTISILTWAGVEGFAAKAAGGGFAAEPEGDSVTGRLGNVIADA